MATRKPLLPKKLLPQRKHLLLLRHLLLPQNLLNPQRLQQQPELPLQQPLPPQQQLQPQHLRQLRQLRHPLRQHSPRDLQHLHPKLKLLHLRQRQLQLRHPLRDPVLLIANPRPLLRLLLQHRMHLIHLSKLRANSRLQLQEAYHIHLIRIRRSLL